MQNQSLFSINDGKSAAFMPQNSIGVTDRHRMTDGPSNPNLLHSQMGYILGAPIYTISGNGEGQGYTILPVRIRCLCLEKMGYVSVGHLLSWIIPKHMALKNIV
jgi:hypothetical protein